MKLAFGMKMNPDHKVHWKDGLWAALNILIDEGWEMGTDNPDFRLFWGNPKDAPPEADGLCYGGGPMTKDLLKGFKVVFVESYELLELVPHPNAYWAFGTNTKLFKPMDQPKIIDALYPAAFAKWKHHEKFAGICIREDKKGLAVGFMQPDNPDEVKKLVEVCVKNGVAVMDWIPTESLVHLYNMSKEVIVTADTQGGSQRTVLEAKACGVPVRIASESPSLLELKDLTRDDVLNKWSERNYAEALKEGISSVLA